MRAHTFLVTGAHGFIGSHLVEHLLRQGHRVRGLVSPWGDLGNLNAVLESDRLEIVRGDIADGEQLQGVTEGVDVVVHAAALARDWGPLAPFLRTNVEGTANLLEEAQAGERPRFVLISSVAVHRYNGFVNASPRTTPRDATSPAYALSKIGAEQLVESYPGEAVIVRPGLWPFGSRDPQLARVVAALRTGRLPLVNGGKAVLNTAFVLNLVAGIELAALTPGIAGRSYVIADEGAPTWREVLGELAGLVGGAVGYSLPDWLARGAGAGVEGLFRFFATDSQPPLTAYQGRLMARDVHFDISHAREELGYRPAYGWREGLAWSLRNDVQLSRWLRDSE